MVLTTLEPFRVLFDALNDDLGAPFVRMQSLEGLHVLERGHGFPFTKPRQGDHAIVKNNAFRHGARA